MADAQRTIDIIFNGVDKTALATQSAISGVSSFSSSVQTATQPIADLTVSAVKLEAGILAIGAAATLAAIYVASDFQSAALDLKKVLSDTEPLEKYKNLALEISSEYGVAASAVLLSMADFRQASFTADESVQLVSTSLDLLIAGGVDVATGSAQLIGALKGFGEEAEQASFIVDLLNGVSNKYATSLGELLTGFSELSPVAKAAGLSMEETAALLTPGIEVFRSGSEVATALRTSLINLVSGTAPVAEALELLSVSQTSANGELRSARDIYFDVAAALQNVDDNQKLYIAGLLAGKNQAARFLAVTDGLNVSLHITSDEFKFLGSAAEEVAIRMQSAEIAAEKVKVAFSNMLIVIGGPLLDEFSGISDAIVNIFAAIGQSVSDGPLKELVDYVEAQMGGLEKTLETIAKNIPEAFNLADLSGFTNGLDAIAEAFATIFKDSDLSTAEGLASAITNIGRAFEGLSLFVGGVIESFGPMLDAFGDMVTSTGELDDSVFSTAGNMAGLATQANLLASGVNSLLPVLEGLLGILLVKQGAGLVGGLGAAASKLSGGGGLVALLGKTGLVGAAGAAGYAVGTVLSDGLDSVVNSFADTEQSLGTWIYDMVNGAEEAELFSASVGGVAESVGKINKEVSETQDLEEWGEQFSEAADNTDYLGNALRSLQLNVVDAGLSFEEFAGSSYALTAAQNDLRPVFSETHDAIIGFEQGVAKAASETDNLTTATHGAVPIIDELTGKIVGYEQGLITTANASASLASKTSKAAQSISDAAKEADRAAAAQARWNEVMLQARVDIQTEVIRGNTEIAVAQIEADALKIQAAYESINTTIESTGQLLGELHSLAYGGDASLREKFSIEKQIGIENEHRAEALELQKDLTAAQIKEMEARAKALARGDGIIQIDGAGLQPHLEGFMWEILRTIQVRVNADGLDMLLGGPVPA